jgi:hypothetical protein
MLSLLWETCESITVLEYLKQDLKKKGGGGGGGGHVITVSITGELLFTLGRATL